MRPALMVIDVQNGWMEMSEGLRASVHRHMATMNGTIAAFRKKGAPIIVTRHSCEENGMVAGASTFEHIPGIEIEGTETVVIKRYMNAFNKTDLEPIVKRSGCDTVVIIGLSALHCVLATYMGAYDRDLEPYLIRNGVAGPDEGSVSTAERICDTLSLRAVTQVLEG